MFRVLPGNVPDVRTVHDLLCRWDELGIVKDATAVLDRGYTSNDNLVELCDLGRGTEDFIEVSKGLH